MYKDKNWLKRQYIDLRKSSIVIAKKCGVTKPTILNWLKKFNIKRRSISEALTSKTLSKKHKENIRSGSRKKFTGIHMDKAWMAYYYLNKKLSTREISKICNIDHKIVQKWLRYHGLPIRDTSSALNIKMKKIAYKFEGINNPNWAGGTSFGKYCILFNNKKKEEIRNRDNRVCQLCGKGEILNGRRLAVHHIDGDKMQGCNGKSWILCALCNSCNSKRDTIEKEFLLISNLMWRVKNG